MFELKEKIDTIEKGKWVNKFYKTEQENEFVLEIKHYLKGHYFVLFDSPELIQYIKDSSHVFLTNISENSPSKSSI